MCVHVNSCCNICSLLTSAVSFMNTDDSLSDGTQNFWARSNFTSSPEFIEKFRLFKEEWNFRSIFLASDDYFTKMFPSTLGSIIHSTS